MSDKKIIIQKDGPYRVVGNVPLVRKEQIVSEHGEPLTWRKTENLETASSYELCRCGQSKNPPFCDDSHYTLGFDGTETAETSLTSERQIVLEGGKQIVVKRDYTLCMSSGYCGNRLKNIDQMLEESEDSTIRSLAIAMIERCPSGSYTYALVGEEGDIEPNLPQEVAVVTEIVEEGTVRGPLRVTGYIPVERADGQPFETRNRVMLCGCGLSKNKPLCDGTHRFKKFGLKPSSG